MKKCVPATIISQHGRIGVLAYWHAGVMVEGRDAFFQWANPPVPRRLKKPDTVESSYFLAAVSRNQSYSFVWFNWAFLWITS